MKLRFPAAFSAAASTAAIVVPTLVALTCGWDYRLAVLSGALLAVACASLGSRCLPAGEADGRAALQLQAGLAGVLFCVYAADWLDWRPFGLDDAFAGLALGLGVLLAGPARRVLREAAGAPNAASAVLQLLAAVPAGAALLVAAFTDADPAQGQAGFLLVGLGGSLVLAWLGTLFALRRALRRTAFVLSALSALAGYGVLTVLDDPRSYAGALGALAGALPPLAALALHAWRNPAARAHAPCVDTRARGVVALCFALLLALEPLVWCAAAGALGLWWWRYYRRGRSLFGPREALRSADRRTALAFAHVASAAILFGAGGLLFVAAATNLTGPMLLVRLGESGLYRVSDLAFSEALMADQYLWRGEPAPAGMAGAATPDRLVRLKRTARDKWSSVDRLSVRAREAQRGDGYGLQLAGDGPQGLRIAYVHPGSSAHAAGLRRGDVIFAIDGEAVPAPDADWRPLHRPGRPLRLGLQRPDAPPRELTISRVRYNERSVSLHKVIHAGGRRVGYVLLRDFDVGAVWQFGAAAEALRRQGIDELVLDLRLNPGGGLGVAREVASVIGGRRLDGATFLRLVHNERYRDRDEEVAFRAPGWGGLALPRLFVITSANSCSASEALINGLAPHMTVVTVGTTTCGKPAGMHVVDYGALSYWVISFGVRNARGEGDYFGGLRPTCEAEDDFAHALGDPAEASLAAALHYIGEGRCPGRASSRRKKPAPGAVVVFRRTMSRSATE